jgi:tetratricopeptide (TPR) repeat protein
VEGWFMTQGNNRCRSWWYWVKNSGYGGIALGSTLLLLPYLVTPQVNAYPMHKLAQVSTDSGRATPNNQNLPRLELGKPIERQLAGNEVHSYQMSVQAGQYLHVVVQQRGINVVVTLFGPDAKPLARSDSPNDDQGLEPVSLIAQTSGSYVLEVRPVSDSTTSGRYEVKIEQHQLATEHDRLRVAAERAFMEASQLYIIESDVDRKIDVVLEQFENSLLEESFLHSILEQAGVEVNERSPSNPEQVSSQQRQAPIQKESELSQQRALTKYQEALQLYRTLGDRFREADTLKAICHVYRNLASAKEALDYCNQALQVYRVVDERSGEADTLQTIGRVYLLSDLDDKQKALSYFQQALQAYQRLSDSQGASFASSKGQANTLLFMRNVYSDLGDEQKQLEVSKGVPKNK